MTEFIGINTKYRCADQEIRQRIHLDGAASPLAHNKSIATIQSILPHYANTHSVCHTSARIMTNLFSSAQRRILEFVSANPEVYTAIFAGSGCTALINRVARGLSLKNNHTTALISSMEHHANDLPYRQHAKHTYSIPLYGQGKNSGSINLHALEKQLQQHAAGSCYVSVSMLSNVTGVQNPIQEIIQLAHQHDALVCVDAAQAIAHMPIELSKKNMDVDFLFFSGHKIYCPFSPGVLVAKKALLTPMSGQDLGGGSVDEVSLYDYQLREKFPDREQSGTPNIIGSIGLAAVLAHLQNQHPTRYKHSKDIAQYAFSQLKKKTYLTLYGAKKNARLGCIAINHDDINHGLLAAILNDYFAIAVRNGCFCAHPYVSEMLKETLWSLDISGIPEPEQNAYINTKRGMVRVSFSLYTQFCDIDYLCEALDKIDTNITQYAQHYDASNDGNYQHKSYEIDIDTIVDITL